MHVFSFRNARWHLLDVKAKYDMWEAAVGHRALAERLFQTAIDLADARQGALFVVLKDPQPRFRLLVSPADQLDAPHGTPGEAPTRGQMMYMLRGRTASTPGPRGAHGPGAHRRCDGHGLDRPALAIGAILLHPEPPEPHSTLAVEGARRPPRWPQAGWAQSSRSARTGSSRSTTSRSGSGISDSASSFQLQR